MLKVLIADDHAVIRQGLRRYLTSTGDITVVAEAATASEMFAVLEHQACDAVLLDVTLGQTSGLDMISGIKAKQPRLLIIMFTMHQHPAYAKSALQRGASGYVSKARPLAEVVTALRAVVSGTRYVSAPLDDVVAIPEPGLLRSLSRRQEQILTLRGQGACARQIGATLGIATKTVSAHEERLLEKLQLTSRHQLLHYAARQSLRNIERKTKSWEPSPSNRDGVFSEDCRGGRMVETRPVLDEEKVRQDRSE